jgi:hypothetical protein
VVLTTEPKVFSELAPLFCKSCTKFVRNDCKAAVDWLDSPDAVLEAAPPVLEAAPPVLEAVPPVLEAVPPVLEAVPPVLEAVPPVLEAVPPKSPINFSKAEFRFDSTLDDKPEEESVLLST